MQNYLGYKRSWGGLSICYYLFSVFRKVSLALLVVLCIVLIITSKANREFSSKISMFFVDVSAPFVKLSSSPFNLLADLFVNTREFITAKKQNEELKEENARLKSLYVKALNIRQENKELRDILKFVSSRSSNYQVANLIGRSSDIYSRSIYVDSGLDQGIKTDSIVIGRNAVIGRVVEVDKNKSRVLLVTDISSRIPVITSRSRTRGVLAGNNSNSMEILYLEKDHNIAIGDMVFTSGDGDSLPSGLLVGSVEKVDHGYAAVRMIESLNDNQIVTVIDY